MRRRDVFPLLVGTAAWPLVARAQQVAMPVIGFLGSSSKTDTQQYISDFLQDMDGFGYVEERSYAMQQRYAEGDISRLPPLVQELLRLQPQVIVADNTPGTLAAKKATPDVPIVGLNMTDPVGLGLVVSEAHPETNVTGTLIRVEGLAGKLLEMARDLVPGVKRIGCLVNSSNPSNVVQRREAESVAAKLGVSFAPVEVRNSDELGPAFEAFVNEDAEIVVVFTSALFITARRQIAAFGVAALQR